VACCLKACLNGPRRPADHPALPTTPDALARDARLAVRAGAGALHVHPKDGDGADSLDPSTVAATLDAIRRAVPGVPVGVTTGAWAEPDPHRRAAVIRMWTVRPDFASVNWHEPGAVGVAEALWECGIDVEPGLWYPSAVAAWRAWPDRGRCLRVLLEVVDDHPPPAAVAAATRLLDALGDDLTMVAVLLHGEGTSCWPVFGEAVRRGLAVRIGLEDVLTLPDGRPAGGNADLVAAARALLDAPA